MGQQIATFEEMWPQVNDGGVYLVEDVHASYSADFDGGYLKPTTRPMFPRRTTSGPGSPPSADRERGRCERVR